MSAVPKLCHQTLAYVTKKPDFLWHANSLQNKVSLSYPPKVAAAHSGSPTIVRWGTNVPGTAA